MHLAESQTAGPMTAKNTPSPAPSIEKPGTERILIHAKTEESTFGASAAGSFYTNPRPKDPYSYQTGFGNRFSSEAM